MRWATWISLLPAIISLLWIQPTFADKRIALMIGNGAYQNTTKLPNPTRDADALAEQFRKVGFDVVQSRRDLGNLEFKRALRELNLAAINADIAVVFFAGHGIEINGVNYLLPVDAKLKRDFDVSHHPRRRAGEKVVAHCPGCVPTGELGLTVPTFIHRQATEIIE